MIANFFRLARSSYAEGLGSLYAYERQVPEIADTKIKGLIEHYNVSSDAGLEYFVVHKDADVEHREQSAILMNQLSEEDQVFVKNMTLKWKEIKYAIPNDISLCFFFNGFCAK